MKTMSSLRTPVTLVAALLTLTAIARADLIRSPTAVLGNTGGDFSAFLDIGNTIDRSGLSTTFVSGVTDFDAYLALAPTHTSISNGNEWFTPSGVTSSTVTFDLGAEYSVTRLALWNEEFAGILSLSVLTSNDLTFATNTAVGVFAPANSPTGLAYGAQVFDLTDTNARYVRLFVTGPQIPNDGHNGIGAGEFAFATNAVVAAPGAPVPEPTTALFGAALLGVVGLSRRRHTARA